MKVLKTKKYEDFKYLEGNRAINQLNVKRIVESMKREIIINPIIVNEKMQIIDGQHRFEALKELKEYVYYIIQEGLGEKQCRLLNTVSKTWSNKDFLEGYIKEGKGDYVKLKEFIEQYNFLSINLGLQLLSGHASNSGLYNKYKEGRFKVLQEKKAYEVAAHFEDYAGTKAFGQNKFFLALIELEKISGYDHQRMVKKLEVNSGKIVKRVKVEEYLEDLEGLYNYKSRDKLKICRGKNF